MQRHGVGLAPDMTGHHRHRANSPWRGHCKAPRRKAAPSGYWGASPGRRSASRSRQATARPRPASLLLHQRHELAGDEGEGDEDGGEHDAWQRKDDLDVVALEIVPEIALGSEQKHVDQAGDHRRHREGKVDQRVQDALPLNSNLAMAQEAARPNTILAGRRWPQPSSVSLMAATASGSVMAAK